MKQTEFLYTEPNLYLWNGNHKDEVIAKQLAEKLECILFWNGPNISIRIDAVKHKPNPDDPWTLDDQWPFLVIDGLVSCRINDKRVSLTPEQALEILEDWHDYKITYEVNEE